MAAPDYVERSWKYSGEHTGESTTRVFEVAWADRWAMVDYLMGDVPDTLPAEDPERDGKYFYCDRIDDMHGEGMLDDSGAAGSAGYDYAVITAQFRSNYEFYAANLAKKAGIVYRRQEMAVAGNYVPIQREFLKWNSDQKALLGINAGIFTDQVEVRETIPYLTYPYLTGIIDALRKQYDFRDRTNFDGSYRADNSAAIIGKGLVTGGKIRQMPNGRCTVGAPFGRRFEIELTVLCRSADFNLVFRPDIATPAYERVDLVGGSTQFKPFADTNSDKSEPAFTY